MQLRHFTWKPIAISPDMYYHTGWYSSAICNNKQESLWATLAGKVKEENNCCFVIDDQYVTISILLKYKPRKRYPFYAGLKIKETFDSVSTIIRQCQRWIIWNLFKRFLKFLYFLFSLVCGVNSESAKRSLFSCLSCLAPSVTRVAICVGLQKNERLLVVYQSSSKNLISISRFYLINLVMHSNQSQSDLLLKKSLSTCLLKIVINCFYKVTYQMPCFQFKVITFLFFYIICFVFLFPLKHSKICVVI